MKIQFESKLNYKSRATNLSNSMGLNMANFKVVEFNHFRKVIREVL